jgi:hypothetical protein
MLELLTVLLRLIRGIGVVCVRKLSAPKDSYRLIFYYGEKTVVREFVETESAATRRAINGLSLLEADRVVLYRKHGGAWVLIVTVP